MMSDSCICRKPHDGGDWASSGFDPRCPQHSAEATGRFLGRVIKDAENGNAIIEAIDRNAARTSEASHWIVPRVEYEKLVAERDVYKQAFQLGPSCAVKECGQPLLLLCEKHLDEARRNA